MSKAPDGRHIFVWRNTGLAENTRRLTELLADIRAAKLFLVDGELAWFSGNQPVAATRALSRELIGKLIAGVRLVQRGDAWETEYYSYDFAPRANTVLEPDELVLAKVLDDLKPLVASGPRSLPRLSEQQWNEVHSRLRQGESPSSIAAYYKTDEAAIEQIARYR